MLQVAPIPAACGWQMGPEGLGAELFSEIYNLRVSWYALAPSMAAIMVWVDLPRAAFALSVAAICISALSLCLTWRRDRRSERAGYPLVELHVMPFPIEPGVHAVMLAVTNREEHHVYLKNFRVLRPRGAAFVEHREESNNTERPTIFSRSEEPDWGQIRLLVRAWNAWCALGSN
jgi:hypothetical protein